jgi:DNA polymerase-3 subunit gamma/tau
MSNHIALYRKYRPENFSNVSGQEAVVDLLSKALKGNKLAHAYLFCGGRGTGKTSVARILAREIGSKSEDIIEIDAASNRGIDEIRELREAVRSMPFSSPYKVYIVDEVHMLTKEAANALLKTLEEPPAHVIFILATTDPDKLPQTIVSRCQKIEFKQPSIQTLAKVLVDVAKAEGKTLDAKAASLLANHGKGSYRDALGILEQVLTRAESKSVSIEDIQELLGIPSDQSICMLLNAMCTNDTLTIVGTLADLRAKNIPAQLVHKELVEFTRIALLARLGEESIAAHHLPDVQMTLKELGMTYPKVINSAKVLFLLEGSKYLSLPAINTYTPLEMLLLGSEE